MPQMAPLNWLFLFIFFLSIFIMFNIFNFYNFSNLNKKKELFKNKIFYNWKW